MFIFSNGQSNEIKDNAANYLIQISEILNKIPREMLLILKTNDVLRGIEYALNIQPNATSFLNMSRCCVRAVGEDQYRQCHSWTNRMRVQFATSWQLFKISVYEFCLWIQLMYSLLFRYKLPSWWWPSLVYFSMQWNQSLSMCFWKEVRMVRLFDVTMLKLMKCMRMNSW